MRDRRRTVASSRKYFLFCIVATGISAVVILWYEGRQLGEAFVPVPVESDNRDSLMFTLSHEDRLEFSNRPQEHDDTENDSKKSSHTDIVASPLPAIPHLLKEPLIKTPFPDETEEERKRFNQLKTVDRPPLKDLIADNETGIIGDSRFLLDFAILGHAKAATSFLMKWLHLHPQVETFDREVCDFADRKPASLVHKLYTELPVGEYRYGYKCPGNIARKTMRMFKLHFNKTRLIVGVRHPVRWFESYYNYRVHHPKIGYTLPPAEELIGACTPDSQGVCTDHANFHVNLAKFGFTNLTNPHENTLTRLPRKYREKGIVDNPVFLYDVGQLFDKDKDRKSQLQADLQRFMGLDTPLLHPDDVPMKTGRLSSKPRENVDICEDKYAAVREELVIIGKRASIWIRHFFLESENVFVSNREHFEAIVKEWKEDPCISANEDGLEDGDEYD